jgi:hypothetical protein
MDYLIGVKALEGPASLTKRDQSLFRIHLVASDDLAEIASRKLEGVEIESKLNGYAGAGGDILSVLSHRSNQLDDVGLAYIPS